MSPGRPSCRPCTGDDKHTPAEFMLDADPADSIHQEGPDRIVYHTDMGSEHVERKGTTGRDRKASGRRRSPPAPVIDHGVLRLQRSIGNRATAALIQRETPPATLSGPATAQGPVTPSRFQVHVVGHASPMWKHPRASTAQQKNMALSDRRTAAVEAALKTLFARRKPPIDFAMSSKVDNLPANSMKTEARGMRDSLKEAGGDRGSNDPSLRRVDIALAALDSVNETRTTSKTTPVKTTTKKWSIKVDIMEGAIGAAVSWGQGEIKNLDTGQSVKGRWKAYGGGGGVDLPVPSVAPGSWTNFETTHPCALSSFVGTPVRLSSLAAGVGVGYGVAKLTFTDLMSKPVTLSGVTLNQWGIGGSVTAGIWDFSQKILDPPTKTETQRTQHPAIAGTSFGHSVSFDTGSDEPSTEELQRLAKFIGQLP